MKIDHFEHIQKGVRTGHEKYVLSLDSFGFGGTLSG